MENIKSLLTVPFSTANYRKFSNNFLNEVDSVPLQENTEIPSMFKNTIHSYTVFGTYQDNEGNNIIILSVKVKDYSNAQKAQRNFVAYMLENVFDDYNAALVAYFDDFRKNWKLSFVTVEYEIGENGVELKFKPAKRFSFLVGEGEPSKTYIQQLSPIFDNNLKPSLHEIENAFSVARLTKDFYINYRDKFIELVSILEKNKEFIEQAKLINEKPKKYAITFAKKTLGQIVFLFFVQKKGWLGVPFGKKWGDGDKQYIQNSFINYNGKSYFDDVLEPLFYQALNKKRIDDIYKGTKIPFLNGGLFHPIEDYNWEKTNFNIPDSFWFNDNETGFLNILSQYNFTVDESDPNEQDVAIDPEMLGRIFESLLDIDTRKNKGAFYTPRNIVQNMCIEALATQIANTFTLDKESTLSYVRYGDALKETDFIEAFAEDIDEYISKLTIVDPAVGSGAFLVGMMNEITKLRLNLQKNYTNTPMSKYDIKINCIQNTLYGVDLEYDAIEIAKLRLWLSLIVDEEVVESAPSPLPNLTFHLRVGNSLLEKYEGIQLWNDNWKTRARNEQKKLQLTLDDYENENILIDSIKIDKKIFFKLTDDKEKTKKLNEIEKKQFDLISILLNRENKEAAIKKLQLMLKQKTKPFFIWHLEFSEVFENGGFDIVIGNPPYISTKGVDAKDKPALKEEYGFADDTYSHFYFLGFNLLKDNGNISYITSKSFWTTQTKKNLRDLLFNYKIDYIFDTANPFEAAMVDTCIVFANKTVSNGENTIKFYDGTESLDMPISYTVKQSLYVEAKNKTIFTPTTENLLIYKKYNEKVKSLYNYWWDKISTSANIKKNSHELENYRNNLKPGDIALLGCLTEGGQGLATANNGKYIAVRKDTKWADNIIKSRPKKLKEAIEKYNISELYSIKNDTVTYINSLSEKQISILFETLKDKYGRDIFGQGYLYKIINESQIANIDNLTDEEKNNGIDETKPHYVLYDKGDKDGNRWYLKTPFAISWTKENVHFLKTNSGKKGLGMPVVRNPQFYFKEGFCWTDINSTFLKSRVKDKGIFDVVSMTLFSQTNIPDWFFVCLINTKFISLYVQNFINNTSHFQINDARQLPIIIPSEEELKNFEHLFYQAYNLKKCHTYNSIDIDCIEQKIEQLVKELYQINIINNRV